MCGLFALQSLPGFCAEIVCPPCLLPDNCQIHEAVTRKYHSNKYEGKSLNNRNFILKCMEKYAQ